MARRLRQIRKISFPFLPLLHKQRTRTRKYLQVGLETSRWTLVGQDHIRETVRKRSTANVRVHGKGIRRGFDLRIGSQSIQGRNVGPNAGVRRQLSLERRRSFAFAASRKHVAEKVSLLVVLFVQGRCRRSLNRGLLLQLHLLNADRSLRRCGECQHCRRRPAHCRNERDTSRRNPHGRETYCPRVERTTFELLSWIAMCNFPSR